MPLPAPEGLALALPALALAAALAWAAGLRLYLVVLAAGIAASATPVDFPPALAPLAHPAVLGAAAVLAALEWRVDRIRGLDCLWDALHTPIRIPAGAALAVLALPAQPLGPSVATAAAGALLAASTHLGKSAVRLLLHADPLGRAPRRGLSRFEEASALAIVWAALVWPEGALAAVLLGATASAWLTPRLWQRLGRVRRDLRDLLSPDPLRLPSPR